MNDSGGKVMTEEKTKESLREITMSQIKYLAGQCKDMDFLVYLFQHTQGKFGKQIVTANVFAENAGLNFATFSHNVQMYKKREAAFNGNKAGGDILCQLI